MDEDRFDAMRFSETMQDGDDEITALSRPMCGSVADSQTADGRLFLHCETAGIRREKDMMNIGMEAQMIELDRHIQISQAVDFGNDAAGAQVRTGIAANNGAAALFHPRDKLRLTRKVESAIQLVDIKAIQAISPDGLMHSRQPQPVT